MGRAWPEATQFPEWVLISSSNRLVLGGRTLGLCCALALSAGFLPPAGMGAEPFGAAQRPQETPSAALPTDPSIVQGRLGNGFGFAIAPLPRRDSDRNSVSFLLQINAGSAFERDDQIGAAKLASEIAARGGFTTDPEAFQRAVESFDDSARAGLRAYATFDTTRFVLIVPLEGDDALSSADIGRIADLLAQLLESAGTELPPSELERSRRDLVAQQANWSGPSQRITARALPVLFGESVFAERVPIYSDEKLRSTGPEAVSGFAQAWYRPSAATLVVAGPVEPKIVQRAVEGAFGRLEQGGDPDVPELAIGEPVPSVLVETDPAVASDVVQLMRIAPPAGPVVDEAAMRARLVERVAIEAMNRRLQDLSRRAGTAALQAGAFSQPNAGGYRMSMVNIAGGAGDWPRLTREAVASINSAVELGFTEAEASSAIGRVRAALESETRSAADRSPGRVASEIASRIRHRDTVISPEQASSLSSALLQGVRPEELSQSIGRLFDPAEFSTLIVTADEPPTQQQVRHQIGVALRIDPAAVARATPLPNARRLTEAPLDGGEVVELTHDPASEVTSATLSNGVRLHHRRMTDPERTGRVEIVVSILGGLSEQCAESIGLTDAIEALEWQPATRSLTGSEIAASIGGRDIDFRVEVHPESVTFEVSTHEDDVETALQLLHILIADGVIESAAFERWRVFATQDAAAARTEPARVALGLFERQITPDLYKHSRSLSESELKEMNADRVNAWLKRLTSSGSLTASIVGDVERNEALRLGAGAFGTLPDRPAASSSRSRLARAMRYPDQMLRMRSEAPLPEATSAVVVGFRTADRDAIGDAVSLDIAAGVLEARLRRRIDSDPTLAASVSVWNLDGEYYPGSGRFWARALVIPTDAERIRESMALELNRLAQAGPSLEETERARRSIADRAERRLRSPRSWAEALSRNAGLGGDALLVLQGRSEAAKSVTPDDVRDALTSYAVPQRSFEITVVSRRD